MRSAKVLCKLILFFSIDGVTDKCNPIYFGNKSLNIETYSLNFLSEIAKIYEFSLQVGIFYKQNQANFT